MVRPGENKKQELCGYEEFWGEYPSFDYNSMHYYCLVSFDGSSKKYYYRTQNPGLKAGDMVLVPVGKMWESEVATVVHVVECKGSYAPYPLEKTKYILGKINVTLAKKRERHAALEQKLELLQWRQLELEKMVEDLEEKISLLEDEIAEEEEREELLREEEEHRKELQEMIEQSLEEVTKINPFRRLFGL